MSRVLNHLFGIGHIYHAAHYQSRKPVRIYPTRQIMPRWN
jgi:hypothetical protein